MLTPIRYSEILDTDTFYVECPTCQGQHGFNPDPDWATAIHPTVARYFNFGDNNYQQNYTCPMEGGPLFKVTFRWRNGGFGIGHYAVEMLPETLKLPEILPEMPLEMLLEMLPNEET